MQDKVARLQKKPKKLKCGYAEDMHTWELTTLIFRAVSSKVFDSEIF